MVGMLMSDRSNRSRDGEMAARKPIDPEVVAITERIKKLMAERGWKPENLAHHSGVPYSSISTYLSDDPAELKVTRAVKIARAFGITVDELATGEDPCAAKRKKSA